MDFKPFRNAISIFLTFYKDESGIFFGKRDNAMMFWFGVFSFFCLGLKIYQKF
tara:strand:- start:1017 stop:1175 length:159 start_codon:yes stop_codon:yes gene_type:complete